MTLPARLVDRLAGVEAKLDRAEKQLSTLDGEMARWRERDEPLGVDCQVGDDGKRWIVLFQVLKPFPPCFGVIVGEIVHDMRSALDHLASYLVETHDRKPTLTAWPILDSPWAWKQTVERRRRPWQLWRKKGGGPLAGIPPTSLAWALIQGSQPYVRSDKARDDPLWTLHQLWNADKHRLLTRFPLYPVTDTMLDDFARLFPAEPIRRKALVTGDRPLKHGTKLALFEFAEPCLPVKMNPRMSIQVAISDQEGDYSRTPIQDTLQILRDLHRDAKAIPYPP